VLGHATIKFPININGSHTNVNNVWNQTSYIDSHPPWLCDEVSFLSHLWIPRIRMWYEWSK
jgi:hypothetical protein